MIELILAILISLGYLAALIKLSVWAAKLIRES